MLKSNQEKHKEWNESQVYVENKDEAMDKEENIAICRQYIVYREGLTRYFMEKYWSGDILGEIPQNWRYLVDFSRYIT